MAMVAEQFSWQGFREYVGNHVVRRYIWNDNDPVADEIMNEVVADANVFCPIVELRVFRQCATSIIIAI